MSGYQRPRQPAANAMNLPRAPAGPTGDAVNAAFVQIENADRQNLKQGIEPVFQSLILISANGSAWRIIVQNNGMIGASGPIPRP